jgi:sec-independent protein translocase protein TatC
MIAVGVMAAVLFLYPGPAALYDVLAAPLVANLPKGATLIATSVISPFLVPLKILLMAAFLLALPVVLYQAWAFVAPGLYSHEKKWAIPFVTMSTVFFIVGAAFAHYIVFPLTWKFFVGFTTDILTFMPRIETSFSLYLRLVLAFGIVFQLPTLVLFLARMGVLTARFMIKNFKYAVLGIVIISAVITPDGGGVSLVAMTGPLVLLYTFSIGLAWMFGKKKEIAEA